MPELQGVVERRLLVNYRVNADVATANMFARERDSVVITSLLLPTPKATVGVHPEPGVPPSG